MYKITIYKLLAEIHDKVEDSILCFLSKDSQKNIKLYDLRIFIENEINHELSLVKLDCKNKGIAFPVGINVNNCAAHESPKLDCETIIDIDDVIKIDYGIHIDGIILDAAFTVCFKEEYRDLLETTRKACMEAAQMFYPNTEISNISKKINSIVNNKYDILKDLCGHQIKPYKIHSGKVIPNIIIPYREKCLEDEVYTVEPYLVNSKSNKGESFQLNTKIGISHYMFNYHEKNIETFTNFLKLIPSLYKFNTLAFHKDWLSEKDMTYLDNLVEKGIYKEYPPIYVKDSKAKISQFETTIIVTSGAPIILKNYNSVDKYILNYK